MFSDLTRDIKAYLYDRARSPLFAAFVASWVVWNFPGALILFADAPLDTKYEMWRFIYATDLALWLRLLIYPLATSAIFILIYPWPARWAFHYWQWHHTRLKELQQRLEDMTPMTREEEKALRLATLDQQTSMQQQLGTLSSLNRDLVRQREGAMEAIVKITKERDVAKETVSTLTLRVSELEKQGTQLREEATMRKAALNEAQAQLAKLSSSEENQTRGPTRGDGSPSALKEFFSSEQLPPNAEKVFNVLVAEDGDAVAIKSLAEMSELSRIEAADLLRLMKGKALVEYNNANAWLSEHGKTTAVAFKLPKRRK